MSTFLFAVWAGGGNVPPQLALARRLAARGHEVVMLAPRVLREQIEAAGVVFEPYGRTPEHDEAVPEQSLVRDFEHRSPLAQARVMRDHLLLGLLEPVAADVLAVLDRRSVDVVAPDFALFGALLAAEKAGVPAACLMHSVLSLPLDGMPPFGTGWTPAEGWRGRARDRVGQLMFDRLFAGPLLAPVNDARRRHGLPALPSALDMVLSADRVLVLTSRSFDFPAAIPANVVYAGPQLDRSQAPWTPPWPDDDPRPLVLVGLSTTYQAHEGVLARVVEALGRLPVRALATSGSVALAGPPPANVHVQPFVPHAQVLPHADAVVTHAGHGTVIGALAHGVPLVCLPISRDQPDVAARVTWHGAGLRLPSRSSPARIATAVQHILDDPGPRAAARRLADRIAAEDGSTAVTELEALADGRPRGAEAAGTEAS